MAAGAGAAAAGNGDIGGDAIDGAEFDYVIIGAGTAGCLLANRLSADPRRRVLLLEAGGADNWIWIHIPVGYLYTMSDPRTDWGFSTEPDSGLNGRSLAYPRGKVLGGCSSINGMIYMRGQARDYDGWRQRGCVGWAWDDVLPWFRRSEDHFAGESETHGAGGEWRVERPRLSWEILDRFADACEEVGIPKVDDFNRGDNAGVGYFQVNQRRGVRWSAATAFLKPARGRPNLTVLTGAHVARLLFEGRRCVGVAFEHKGAARTVRAAGEVVLSAGAVASPVILQRSGVGPEALLRDHGIAPVHPLAGVGENLQDHLQVRAVYKVTGARTLNQIVRNPLRKAWMGIEYALFRTGPLTMAPSQLGAFARSDPSYETPNLEYHVQPLSLDKFGEPLHPFPAFTASVCNLRPESRGSVHLRSADPQAKPLIRPNYLSAPADRRVAAQALTLTRKIVLETRAMRPFAPEEYKPGLQLIGEDELARAAGDISTTIFHPVGTTRMGAEDDPGAVVDPRLRLRGISGLRVVDAGAMPTITSGNTNSPTLMIAEKGAAMILEDAAGR